MEDKLILAAKEVQKIRREYTKTLEIVIQEDITDVLAVEDLIRLVGTLEAAYNHLLSAAAGDGDLYCVYKHLSYALILAGEVGSTVGPIYNILSILTDGKIEPCSACKEDKKGD